MRKRSDERASHTDRLKSLTAAAKRFKSFRPAREVLTRVRAVPTCFPQFDHATRVGGLPIERFMLVHGPSNHGKTVFTMGLIRSFLAQNNFAVMIDAERTTPITWVETMMGGLTDHPGFFGNRPDTYEDTIKNVREFLTDLIKMREAGDIHKDTAALIVVDSLRKLVPKDLMKEILEADGDITAGKDRSAQIKAKMNAAWMDELVPLLEKAQAGFIAIAREMQDPDANIWSKKYGTDYKIGGGSAIIYDSSLVMRVERAGWITDGGEGKDAKIYGERHRVTIGKTKVAGKDDKKAISYFHTSNGTFMPEGFDVARDLLELGERVGVVTKSGSSYSFGGERIGAGLNKAVLALNGNVELLEKVDQAVRAKFMETAPIEVDEDGVVS